ncbi:MAG: helix-turn-helix domain-containing protein [bacterium]
MEMLEQLLPEEVAVRLGAQAKALRLSAGWKRATLSQRAGISEASLKRFEQTGQASLGLVLRVALSLGRLPEFESLLAPPPARSMDELERRLDRPLPKRGVR